jgi:N-acetylneuraminate synthase
MLRQIMKIVKNRFIESSYPYFIADIAANHDGDLVRAKELIWMAKEAGADCAKFQHFVADKIVNDREFSKLTNVNTHQSSWLEPVSVIYDKYHFRREWTEEVVAECARAEIDFSTTPYDQSAIDSIRDLVPFIKIGSGDISWLEHIENCAETQLPIIISTGASDNDDVERCMSLLAEKGNQVCIMQCNTNYTVDRDKFRYVNLNVLRHYAYRYPEAILGLSDHTTTATSVLGAVALGAKIIEKHFTDDNDRIGPDHKFAINPADWRAMVEQSCELVDTLGDGVKKIEENEANTYIVQRRACTLSSDLEAGHVLSESDLVYLRPFPPGSVQPFEMPLVLGRSIDRALKKGDALLWQYLSE